MSEHWAPDQKLADMERVPVWARPAPRHFTARGLAAGQHFHAWAEDAPTPPLTDPEALIAAGYAQGLAEGRRTVEKELAAERAALVALAEAIETVQPEPPAALAALLAETVKRLVGQIVGEVAMDETLLAERVQAVAAAIADEDGAGRIRLHPSDRERLTDARVDFELVADPALTPGTIIAETGAGWVEDGPAIRLEKLRGLLDRMGVPR